MVRMFKYVPIVIILFILWDFVKGSVRILLDPLRIYICEKRVKFGETEVFSSQFRWFII